MSSRGLRPGTPTLARHDPARVHAHLPNPHTGTCVSASAHVFTHVLLQKGRAHRNTTTQNKASVILIISAEHFLYIDSFNPGNNPKSGTIVPISDEETEAPRGKVTSPRVTWLTRGRAETGTQAVWPWSLCCNLYCMNFTFSEPGRWDVSHVPVTTCHSQNQNGDSNQGRTPEILALTQGFSTSAL